MAERDELLEHNYDGIQEYDNDLPSWWKALCWLTLIYGLGYLGYYHLGPGLHQEEQLKVQMAELDKVRAKHEAAKEQAAPVGKESLLALVSNAEALAKGKEVYMAKCIACHADQGQGLVGPNLTDEYWIHGGTLMDIRNVVMSGVPAKGMLPWKGVISDDEIDRVVAYVWSIRGTDPPNPKKPEGELVPIEQP